MQGDFSRNTFSKENHYRGVLQQQGRVQLDADLNEQQAITQYYDETSARDLIGPTGVPKSKNNGNGFKIGVTSDQQDLTIAQGSIYVDGILCENEKTDATYRYQGGKNNKGDFPQAPDSGKLTNDQPGIWLVYLDVWQRHITALDDPNIREKALGGPDTATRIKTVWQVKLAKVEGNWGTLNCSSFKDWTPFHASTGKLIAKTDQPPASIDSCKLLPTTGFRRLENQLYRVEIHKGGSWEHAKFKWSRDNGSITASIEDKGIDNDTITLENINRDEVMGFSRDQWVEILSDYAELNTDPDEPHGKLVKIKYVDPSNLKITTDTGQQSIDKKLNPKLRRWDYTGDYPEGIPVKKDWIHLEDGIWIKFSGDKFCSGDYWLIPARTATDSEAGHIEWPSDGDKPAELEREGIYHHYCPLAFVEYNGTKFNTLPEDCRHQFPPLTDINAVDVGFDNNCKIPDARTVQDALDYLCKRQDGGCMLLARPGEGWETIFDRIADGQDAKICFHVGEYILDTPITLKNKGHLCISGSGFGTRIISSKSETVFKFESCKSVEIHNLYAETGQAGFGKESKLKHLNGVFTFDACPKINIENVELKCASGAQQAATCITVKDTTESDSKKANIQEVNSVRIRNSNLFVGNQQVGILLVNVSRAVVEDNLIRASKKSKSLSLQALLENKKYRSEIRSLMINSPVLGTPKKESTISKDEVLISAGKGSVRFKTAPSLINAWKSLFEKYSPEGIQSDQDLLLYLSKTADNALLNKGVVLNSGRELNVFENWYDKLLPKSVGSQGIIIGGSKAQDIHISNNAISGFKQGIHVGVSHRGNDKSYDIAGVVHIFDNNISVLLSSGSQRNGIFVGNCDSLIVQNNYIEVKRLPTTLKVPIDGIKVYGFLGRMVIIRQNHLVNTTVGIRFKPLGPISGKPQWIITDNVAPKSETSLLPSDESKNFIHGSDNYS